MNQERYGLPDGWEWVKLGSLLSFVGSGITPKGGKNIYQSSGVAFIRSQNVYPHGLRLDKVAYVTPKLHETMSRTHLQPNDVLLNITGASIGRSTVVPASLGSANVNQHVCILRPSESVDARYLSWFLNSPFGQGQIMEAQSGVTRQGLNYRQIRTIDFPLASLSEQHRIVEEMESLFAQSRAARAALDRIPALLKKFRQVVLAAAFRGGLTDRDPSDEPASVLLERIRTERRHKWEEELRAKGKDPSKIKYVEPELPDTRDLPDLPEGWIWTSFSWLVASLKNGIYKPPDFYGSGVPCLRMYNIEDGKIVWKDIKLMRLSESEVEEYGLVPGDILVNRVNSRELVGKAAVIPNGLGRVVFESKNIRMRIWADSVPPGYVSYFLLTRMARNQIEMEAKQTVGMATISQVEIMDWHLPLAPLAEQHRIVARVQALFAQAEAIERAVELARRRVEKVDQAILARAFRGTLI